MAVNRLNVGATNQLLAKASTGQSTNILELQNTAGVTVAGVDASGNPVGGLAHPANFKNLVINGDMQVAQRGTSLTGQTALNGYPCVDRMAFYQTGTGTLTLSQENDAPTGSGFRKSLKVLATTGNNSLSAGAELLMIHRLEGQNLQHIVKGTSSAKQLTLSFWVKSNVTGTYIAALQDNDNTRYIGQSYTINASATWEKKTLTFAADTTGVLDNDNENSLQLLMWLAAGTNSTSGTLSTSWASTVTANRAVGQTNMVALTNNYWQVTGVQLEVGSTATEFEFKPYGQELQECQRYYWRYGDSSAFAPTGGIGRAISTTASLIIVSLPQTMRAKPSSVEYSNLAVSTLGVAEYAVTSLSINSNSNQAVTLNAGVASGLTLGTFYGLINNNSTSGYLGVSAEL
jgi:hypothetical protein